MTNMLRPFSLTNLGRSSKTEEIQEVCMELVNSIRNFEKLIEFEARSAYPASIRELTKSICLVYGWNALCLRIGSETKEQDQDINKKR